MANAHQHSFGFDLTQPIAELRRRLAEVASSPQSGSGAAATSWRDGCGSGWHRYGWTRLWRYLPRISVLPGPMALSHEHFARILQAHRTDTRWREVLPLTTQEHTSVWRENAWQGGTPGRVGSGMPGVSLLGLKSGFVFPILLSAGLTSVSGAIDSASVPAPASRQPRSL